MKLLPITLISVLLGCTARPNVQSTSDVPSKDWREHKDEIRLQIIDKLLDEGEILRALGFIKMLTEEGCKDPRVDLYRSVAFRKEGMLTEARASIENTLERMPKSADAHGEQCIILFELKELEAASAACLTSLSFDKNQSSNWNNLGFIYLSTPGKEQQAVDALEQAVNLDGTNPRYRNNLSFAHVANGSFDAAMRGFLATNPSDEAYYNMAVALERRGSMQEAASYYERALSVTTNHRPSLIALERLNSENSP